MATTMSSDIPILEDQHVAIEAPSSSKLDSELTDDDHLDPENAKILQAEAANIQESLAVIVERIAKIKGEYDRLSSENLFLQDYIGNLMSTGNLISK